MPALPSLSSLSAPLHGKLQHKFFLGLAGMFLLLGVVLLVTLNMHLREMLHIEAEAKAELVFSHLSSLQEYVRETLRPTVRNVIRHDEFLLEAMSTSFVTRRVLVDLNTQRDQYLYRRVALSPRNPASEANELERGLIRHFKNHPDEHTYRGYKLIDGVEYFVLARPVHFDQECLACHGDPQDAPRVLIERYGAVRGFGRKEGELAGLDFVGTPVDKSLKHIQSSISLFGASFFAVSGGVFLLILIFFNRLVVANLRRLSGIFRANFTAPGDQSILAKLDGGDEINSLLKAFGEFASHLRQARSQLEDYAANLEDKVRRRTTDLSREAQEHQTDVRLFVELLGDLNRSQGHDELLGSALPRIAQRFGADRIAYLCSSLGRHRYHWPDEKGLGDIPENWLDLARAGQVRIEGGRVCVPVATSELSRGLMALTWDSGAPPTLTSEVLLALGQQLGIALENLEAINALLRQNQLLELIVEGIGDPLLLVDEGGAVVLANSSARALAEGCRPGARVLDWFAAMAAPEKQTAVLARAIAADRPASLEFQLPGPRYLAVGVYPLRDGGGMGRAVVFVRETTAEKRLMAQMQQSEKLAALGQLAAGLAHEINNPLGVISCYAQLLQRSQKDPQAQSDLEVIVRHTNKAKEVLQGLLGLARVDKPAKGPSDLGAVVRDMERIFRAQAEACGVRLELDLAADLPAVEANASALEQILTNLLVNALDAAPRDSGVIRVSTEAAPDGRSVRLRVADNGPGIPPENLGRIFDPFFTTKEINKGTGLGLTVVHELLRELHGTVEVLGGPGAIFVLTFPAADGDAAGEGPKNAEEDSNGRD
jgi:signal transduction histidine kinase